MICSNQQNTQPLHVRRIKQMARDVFKIINKMPPGYINDLVEIKTSTYNFRAERQAEVPRVNATKYGLRYFRWEAAQVWNSLPNELRVAVSSPPPPFRRLIHSWDSAICGCPLCSTWLRDFQLFSGSVLLTFSLSVVLVIFPVCVFLIFRLGKPVVLPFSLFA